MDANLSADFGAKNEPRNQVLVGAGQVNPADYMDFAKAMNNEIKPIIFMDYFDAHDLNLNVFFDSLELKLKSIPANPSPIRSGFCLC